VDLRTPPGPEGSNGSLLRICRGHPGIFPPFLDADLARLYGVETRALNQAVKRNIDRFPEEFAFDLTREEILSISQTVTSLAALKFSKSVRAFTEYGSLQAANVLSSPQWYNHFISTKV